MIQPRNHPLTLDKKYPPSEPCDCDICRRFCRRPGWWSVAEAEKAFAAGYGPRRMLEMAADLRFGVLSPAFRGCEGTFAFSEFSVFGCNFLSGGLCELHGTDYQPLECRFCHHLRAGQGAVCHLDLEKDWDTAAGQSLVRRWAHSPASRIIYPRGSAPF